MANNRNTYQQISNVSINKNKLISIATNYGLSETDLRVLICLFTELNGWSEPEKGRKKVEDPLNFTKIDKDKISKLLDIKKKETKKSLNNLMEAGLVESGYSDTVENGYRFTF